MKSNLVIISLGADFSLRLSKDRGSTIYATTFFIIHAFAYLLGRLTEVCKDPENCVHNISLRSASGSAFHQRASHVRSLRYLKLQVMAQILGSNYKILISLTPLFWAFLLWGQAGTICIKCCSIWKQLCLEADESRQSREHKSAELCYRGIFCCWFWWILTRKSNSL